MARISKTAVVAYVPVLHQGYISFFRQHAVKGKILLLITRELFKTQFPQLEKDIRALTAIDIKKAIVALEIFKKVSIISTQASLSLALNNFATIILPDDEVMRFLAENFLLDKQLQFENIFLRWDKKRSLSKKHAEPTTEITTAKLHQQLMKKAKQESQKSADWWRQIGGLVVRHGQILLTAYNKHLPNEQQPYIDGDPRSNFHQGEQIELSTALHAEQALIAEAAKKGLSLAGADLYVTTFPCPTCAKLVASCGISRVFFHDGYSMVAGAEIMEAGGIQLIKVND